MKLSLLISAAIAQFDYQTLNENDRVSFENEYPKKAIILTQEITAVFLNLRTY